MDKTLLLLVQDVAQSCDIDLEEALAVVEFLEVSGLFDLNEVRHRYGQ